MSERPVNSIDCRSTHASTAESEFYFGCLRGAALVTDSVASLLLSVGRSGVVVGGSGLSVVGHCWIMSSMRRRSRRGCVGRPVEGWNDQEVLLPD